MFRGQFLMLRAIFKVMELSGGDHCAQKILKYRFWLVWGLELQKIKKQILRRTGEPELQKLKKQILQRTPTNKNKMFRRQFLMLQAILKVMELFGGAHGAQKILNYRFWLLLSTKVAARLSKSVDERQKDTKTNFEVGFHFLKYCKGKGFGRRRQPQWLQWELCSCWLSVGSPANQHTLCHGCHWDSGWAIDGANIAALEHGPLWVLILD